MLRVVKPLLGVLGVLVIALPVFAGALTLGIGNPVTNPEAQSKNAVLLARTTACHSPEKSKLTATAEGFVNGVHRSIPLKVIPLSTSGTFVVTREWPPTGKWAVRIVATNPEYKNYATGVLVPLDGNSVEWTSIKHYFHEPTDEELASLLNGHSDAGGTSIK